MKNAEKIDVPMSDIFPLKQPTKLDATLFSNIFLKYIASTGM